MKSMARTQPCSCKTVALKPLSQMKQRSQVPKFGNWDNEDHVPYTAVFDNARKGRSGVKMNPNDPQDNPDYFSNHKPAPFQEEANHRTRASREEDEHRRVRDSPLRYSSTDSLRSKHDRRLSREEVDARKLIDSPVHYDTIARKGISDSPHHRSGGVIATNSPKRVSRQSVGSDRSLEQSPLHPHHPARVGNKGSATSSPSWERKGSPDGLHGLAPLTPGRSRLRSVTRGDETPDRGPAVPKFGDWDETDPASAEGFTHIFDKVREEKHNTGGKIPIMPTEKSYMKGQKNGQYETSLGCGCFPWSRK